MIIISAIITFFATYLSIPVLKNLILDKPNKRSSHYEPKPSGGGIIFVTTIFINALLNNYLVPIICIPLSIIGLIDDKYDLKPNLRLFSQILTVIFLLNISPLTKPFMSINHISINLVIIFVLVFLSTAAINFINFMDGLDGLLAGCMIIIFSVTSIYLKINLWPYIGCILGFLFLNWYPSKLFMGDVGSTFLGAFFVGIILQTDNFIDALKILLLASPLLGDSLISVIKRLFSGKSIIIPHKSFYFQKLNKGILSHDKVSIIYITATLILGLALLFGNLTWMIVIISCELLVLLALEKKFVTKN